ncbi:MAG: GNAT family N-acetyltransferase [bacterium]|nr:GNAT family N-acetyltransferase [bacterium]
MTGDVLLRDVLEEDFPVFFEHQLDPDACAMAAFAARERDAFMLHWTEILSDDTIAKKTILFDGRVAGYIVSFGQPDKQQLGYWIGKTFWGKGVATRALLAFLGFVKTRPLHAHVAKHNLASLRVLEKCGFTIHGEDTAPSEAGDPDVEEFVLRLGSDGGS